MKILILVIALVGSFAACEKPQETHSVEIKKTKKKKKGVAGPIASLPAKGRKFTPPVAVDQLPDGAFYCDMGNVHWAASENPSNKKCPICGMNLTQKTPSTSETTP